MPIHVLFGETLKNAAISASFFGKGNRAFKFLHCKNASDRDFWPLSTRQYLPLKTSIFSASTKVHLETIPRLLLAKVLVAIELVEDA